MRITLTIDDDVLVAAKAIARQEHRSLGEVVSELIRGALYQGATLAARNGIPLLAAPDGKTVVTLDIVNALLDEAL
jgi:hypothetical protein